MRWHKPSFKAIHSFWGQRAKNEAVPHARIDDVRAAMLQATPPDTAAASHAALFRRIHRADSLQALWYMRSDLMAAIAARSGEEVAQMELAAITRLFDGLIPETRNAPVAGAPPRQR